MPRPALFFLSLLILSLGMLAACAPAASSPFTPTFFVTLTPAPDRIRLANGSWAPYNGADLAHAGCDSWAVQEAFALEGISVQYEFFPWARSYSFSATGEWDGTPGWADTPEHRQVNYVSAQPTSTQEWVFFYRSDHPLEWKTLNDLSGKTIGITTGYVYSNVFKDLQAKKSAAFVESSSDEANFKMLLAGRIDVFPIERQVGRYLLKSTFTSEERAKISESPQPFSQFLSYLLLSKAVPANQQRMALFDRGFKSLQSNGKYVEIMKSCAP
jgi:polar amino acid transport system substrate-binding protein